MLSNLRATEKKTKSRRRGKKLEIKIKFNHKIDVNMNTFSLTFFLISVVQYFRDQYNFVTVVVVLYFLSFFIQIVYIVLEFWGKLDREKKKNGRLFLFLLISRFVYFVKESIGASNRKGLTIKHERNKPRKMKLFVCLLMTSIYRTGKKSDTI